MSIKRLGCSDYYQCIQYIGAMNLDDVSGQIGIINPH